MKLTPHQIDHLTKAIFETWKSNNIIVFKEDEKVVMNRMHEIISEDFSREGELERDVNKMLDQLEKTNSGEFQRFKMYPILKQKLAKERKIIL